MVQLNILPLGDSITEGTVPGGYRAPLYTSLISDGFGVTYLGDRTTNSAPALPSNETSHEGIPGINIVNLQSQIDSTSLIQRVQPNVVLLLIGQNDIGNASVDAQLSSLLDDIIAKDLTVHIFLSNILHRANDPSGFVTTTDATFPTIVAQHAANVSLVDMASVLTLGDLSSDGIHPTQAGYVKMSNVWDTAIKSYESLSVKDGTQSLSTASATTYTGAISGPTSDYANVTSDSLNIAATSPNWFIQTGSGNDAISVRSGSNAIDGGDGSNFLVGGTGTDKFFLEPGNSAMTWSTIINFHSGDDLTVAGVSDADFNLVWMPNLGAVGETGLTALFVPRTSGHAETDFTLAGFTAADLTNGHLTIASAANGSMTFHAT